MTSYSTTGTTVGDGSHYHQGDTYNTYNSSSTVERPKSVYDVPDLLSPHFVGRDTEIQKLHEAFSNKSGLYPRRCIVYGMPGLGKTQLALKYAKYALEELRYPYIFWISATSSDRLLHGFSNLSDVLALPGRKNLDQHARTVAVRRWLEHTTPQEPRKWLIILDNATEEAVPTIRERLPRQNAHGAILITTRTQEISKALSTSSGELHVQLALEVLNDPTSVHLLYRASGALQQDSDPDDLAAAKSVVSSVGYLPLAIEQAGSLMKVSGCSLTAVRDIYKSDRIEEALEQEIPLSHYEKSSVMAVYDSAIQQLQDPLGTTTNILRLLTFMDPESISINIIKEGLETLEEQLNSKVGHSYDDEMLSFKFATLQGIKDICETFNSIFKLSSTLKQLQALSLITQNHDGSSQTVRFHDLTQLILRMKLVSSEAAQEEWLLVIGGVLEAALGNIANFQNPESWSKCDAILSHARALWRNPKASSICFNSLWNISVRMGGYLFNRKRYEEAHDMLKTTLSPQVAYLGSEHPLTLRGKYELARVLTNLGHLDSAQDLSLQVVDAYEWVYGSEHRDSRKAMVLMGFIYRANDQLERSRLILERVLGMQLQLQEADSDLTLRCEEYLMQLYLEMKLSEEAEGLANLLVDEAKRIHGSDSAQAHKASISLALANQKLKKWGESVMLLQQAEIESMRLYGVDHPSTLRTQIYLGEAYRGIGKLQEAVELMKSVTSRLNEILGPDHPFTLLGLKRLAEVYRDQGQWEKALSAATEVLERRTSLLGPDKRRTNNARNLVVEIAQKQKKAERGEDDTDGEEDDADSYGSDEVERS